MTHFKPWILKLLVVIGSVILILAALLDVEVIAIYVRDQDVSNLLAIACLILGITLILCALQWLLER